MAGLLILILGGLYIAVALYVSLAKVKPWWGKVIAVVVFTLLPTADAFYGRFKLEKLCKEEGGLRIYRTVQDVDGFYSPYADKAILTKYGFEFIESGEPIFGYIRFSRSADRNVVKEKIKSLKSRYEYRMVLGDSRDIYIRDVFQMITRDTNEVLGEIRDFNYAGGWVERFAASLVAARGNGGTCNLGPPRQRQERLIVSTLKPIR